MKISNTAYFSSRKTDRVGGELGPGLLLNPVVTHRCFCALKNAYRPFLYLKILVFYENEMKISNPRAALKGSY